MNHSTLCILIALSFGCAKKNGNTPVTRIEDKVAVTAAAAATAYHTSMVLFNGGNESIYHSFRIPSIIKTKNGTLLAFAEGRRWSPSDWGDINVVFKRSTDNGATWSALGEVVGSGAGTWGNPTAVYDKDKGTNGRAWVFMSWNDADKAAWGDIAAWGDRRVFSSYSDDQGLTWSTPQDMSSTLLPPNYTWDAMGPGIGIQVGTNVFKHC